MQSFSLEFNNGHLIIIYDDYRFIFDTGSPGSFGIIPVIKFDEKSFSLQPNFSGVTVQDLSNFLEIPVSGLIGADIINKFDILINLLSNMITFSSNPLETDGEIFEIENYLGIPVVKLNINNKPFRFFFDTGAKFSYFQEVKDENFPYFDTVQDFYPGLGYFETELYLTEIFLGDLRFYIKCGILPELLEMTLKMANIDGILGNEVMQNRIIGLFMRKNILTIK